MNPTKNRPINEVVMDWIGVLPFFVFITAFLIFPSLNLFSGAFKDPNGNFTFSNLNFFADSYVIKSYVTSLQVSVITSLVGGVFGYVLMEGRFPKARLRRWIKAPPGGP